MCADSSPFHDAPTRNSAPTIPAPASQDEARLELKLERDRKRKRAKKQTEAAVLAWIASEKAQRDS